MEINWWGLLAPLLAGLAIFYVQRISARADKEMEKAEVRHRELEKRVSTLEMKVAAEMPSREDFKEQSRRIEGAGSMWNGIAIGIALGAVIAGSAWMAYRMQEMDIRTRQAEAYKAAVYMLAPRFAEEIDKELRRSTDEKKEADKQ